MNCISPVYVKGDDGVVRYFACNKCAFCLEKRAKDWAFRLSKEYKSSKNAFFLTLTYRDDELYYEDYDIMPSLYMRDVQLFIKKLRVNQDRAGTFDKIKYFAVGEYGPTTHRPHYHIIVFNLHPKVQHKIQNIWNKGDCTVSPLVDERIFYTVNYVNSIDDYKSPKMVCSKGLGDSYLEFEMYHKRNNQFNVVLNGKKQRLPRYYKDRFFTSWEKKVNAKKVQDDCDKAYLQTVERRSLNNDDGAKQVFESISQLHENKRNKLHKTKKSI